MVPFRDVVEIVEGREGTGGTALAPKRLPLLSREL